MQVAAKTQGVIGGHFCTPSLSVAVKQFLRHGAGRGTNLSDAIFASTFTTFAAKSPPCKLLAGDFPLLPHFSIMIGRAGRS